MKYLARGSGYGLSLTAREAILTLRTADSEGERGATVVKIGFPGSQNPTQISGLDELPGKSNYFIGSDQRKWRSNVPNYQKVKYKNIYPGINAIFYGSNQRQLEYDFVIAPQAKPNEIRLTFQGVKSFSLDKNGELILRTPSGDLRQRKPVAYQEVNGERRIIEVDYELFSQKSVGFKLGKYDRSKELIIDPVLSYSTYLGGTGTDTACAIAIDKDGNAYIAGETFSNDFPGASQIQPARGNPIESFILKLNPAGTQIVYATWLGGDRDDFVRSIVVDASGNAYVTGATSSSNFPTTTGALQRANRGAEDTFLTKINPTGTALVYSTLLGGNGSDAANDLAVDSGGNTFLGGRSSSTDLPATGFQLTRKGNSFYKSTNQAGNWTAGGAGLLTGLTNSLTIDPSTPSILYAATVSGVYKSADGGNQWQQLGAFASPSQSTYQVVIRVRMAQRRGLL